MLPDDPDYGNSVPLEYEQYFPGYFVYKAYIANITNEEQTYTIFVEVRDSDNNIFATDTHTVTALPHTWWSGEDLNRTNRIDGELHPVALYAPGIYTIQFRLIESGIVQDVKVIEFKVVD